MSMATASARARQVLPVLLGVLAAPRLCDAQPPSDAFLNQQRAIEEELRREFDAKRPLERRLDVDWGGWYTFYLFLYDDGVNSSRTYRRNDLRLWARLGLDEGAHEGYVRARLSYLDFNTGDSFDGNDDDWDGPNLERGYYQFDLKNAIWSYERRRVPYNLRLKIGRDFVELGTGYAISLPLDHVALTGEWEGFELMGLMGRTPTSLDDIDRTRPGRDGSKRNFFGFETRYAGFEKHRPFFYGVWQDDKQGEDPRHLLQDFTYDSYYLGIGATGELAKELRYSTEWVYEGGRSFGDRKFLRQDHINAWAFDVQLEYLAPWKAKPRFLFEYMFASGDANRFGSPTDAIGGNTYGNDSSFVGFGYRDTGLSFAPRLSNIHVWRLGFSFFPFEDIRALREMELGTDWFLYAKNRAPAAVSDPLADQGSAYLGWEMDYFANWRVTSDLAVTVRYGAFFPGDAFSDQTTRTFFLTGLTWSF